MNLTTASQIVFGGVKMEGHEETKDFTVTITVPANMDPTKIQYVKVKNEDMPSSQELPFQVQVRSFYPHHLCK